MNHVLHVMSHAFQIMSLVRIPTPSFFMSSLVSVVANPKPDQDCADKLLMYLAVLHLVMGTLPMWKDRPGSVTDLSSDIATFTDQLSDENKERCVCNT